MSNHNKTPMIIIHGIGNYNPGYLDQKKIQAWFPKHHLVEFSYEDILEEARANRWLKLAGRLAASYYGGPLAGAAANHVQDTLNDIFTYFFGGRLLGTRTRDLILAKLHKTLRVYRHAPTPPLVVGHSLGAVVATEALSTFTPIDPTPGQNKTKGLPTLVTLGSPMGAKFGALVRRLMQHKTPRVSRWINVYNRLDPIAGDIPTDANLPVNQQHSFRRVRHGRVHDLDLYLEVLRDELPTLI